MKSRTALFLLLLLPAGGPALAASLPDAPYVSTSASAVEEVAPDYTDIAARFAAHRMTAGERRALDEFHQRSTALVHAGAQDDYEAFNIRFHTLLYEGCHSGYLRDLAVATRSRLAPFRRAQFRLLGRLRKSWEEHDAIVTAILRGDTEAAGRAARAHVLTVSAASASFVSAAGRQQDSG